jgi:MtN3 and saliva related transmembrane protein
MGCKRFQREEEIMIATNIGLVAGALTSIAVIPQVVKTYRTRHARDISIWQPLLLDIGMILWLIYGILLKDLPLILANAFSIVCNTLLIFMKIYFRDGDNIDSDDYIKKKM